MKLLHREKKNKPPSTSPPEGASPKTGQPGFPDPTITLIEFDDALGLLLAARTERDQPKKRLVLHKVAYVRIEPKNWGAAAYPEVHISQENGLFTATDARSGQAFRYPSRRRYETAFLNKDIFECAIQCVRERKGEALIDLVVVNFGDRPDFGVESSCLLAPDDYAAEHDYEPPQGWVDFPARANI